MREPGVIARRIYDTDQGPFEVSLMAPVIDANGIDHACTYAIAGPVTRKTSQVFGIDAFQAIDLALKRIALDVAFSEENRAGQLRWLDQADDLGFVLPYETTGPEKQEPRDQTGTQGQD